MTETLDNLEAIRRDIISLATGLKALNDYGSRLATVESVCISILAPSPFEAQAQEDLASLSAAAGKHKQIMSVTAEWDKQWHFIFSFRFTTGYWTGDGFDLRAGEPGQAALLKALDVVKLEHSICDLSEPDKAGTVPSRRLIFPMPKEESAK
jgi:hypothetical protein